MLATSIIIPNYNGGRMLRECIRSIQTHTHLPHEIIVVDNGSSDKSVSYCLKKDKSRSSP
ncbi:glycosyltransferase family A protein [Paenibacillus larvae]|uniref:glycosyltransferase family 2 protein n=1 Tax=Paenibacillus larvae TaxID=1464 RepID=UPI002B265132|nr:glycosyltransferase family A protein [Paenibacillus larvae]